MRSRERGVAGQVGTMSSFDQGKEGRCDGCRFEFSNFFRQVSGLKVVQQVGGELDGQGNCSGKK